MMPETVQSSPRSPDNYGLTRFLILRLLGCVYAVAFLAAAKPVLPLIGSSGLLPVGPFRLFMASSGEPSKGGERHSCTRTPTPIRRLFPLFGERILRTPFRALNL